MKFLKNKLLRAIDVMFQYGYRLKEKLFWQEFMAHMD